MPEGVVAYGIPCMKWWRKLKRRRSSFDPLASQARTTRRPGEFNAQADSSLSPNAGFLETTWVAARALEAIRRPIRCGTGEGANCSSLRAPGPEAVLNGTPGVVPCSACRGAE